MFFYVNILISTEDGIAEKLLLFKSYWLPGGLFINFINNFYLISITKHPSQREVMELGLNDRFDYYK